MPVFLIIYRAMIITLIVYRPCQVAQPWVTHNNKINVIMSLTTITIMYITVTRYMHNGYLCVCNH